ncbi:hypothetical protein EV424DRAFT_1607056 [Suillus variegatus]|nr:hypothetical protein EV424DRAFT_1607056 [Suillus variegatus]
MITAENTNASTDNRSSDGRKQSPPAFLDLADSAARLGTNMPDMSARIELKRLEHERQRLLQRKMFEDQMRALEQQQAQELLSSRRPLPPPRVNAVLNGDNLVRAALSHSSVDAETLSKAVDSAVADKRKSVTYAPSVHRSSELGSSHGMNGHYGRPAGAKSMPASRRTSSSSHDDELASHLQGLSLVGERPSRATPSPGAVAHSLLTRGRYNDEERSRGQQYNVGMMLDEQLDQEMHSK